MKKARSIRFNNMVDVYKEFPMPLVDKEDSDVIEPVTDTEDNNVTEPAMDEEEEDSNVTEPEMDEEEEDSNVSEPEMDEEESVVSESAMDEEESDVTEPETEIESNVTEPAMETESNVTEPAIYTDINVTESTIYTDFSVTESAIYTDFNVTESAIYTDFNVTESAIYTDSSMTESAIYTADSYVSEPAMDTYSYVTKPAATVRERNESTIVVIDSRATDPVKKTEDDNLNDMALDITETVIAEAINTVEEDDEYTIKNIKWLTHGEFTPEKCRKQIQDFVMSWEYEDRWVHYTKLVERRDLIHSFHYIYSVRWSVPTSQTPTAYSSAFAFFTVKFNKNKPPFSSSQLMPKSLASSLTISDTLSNPLGNCWPYLQKQVFFCCSLNFPNI
ncbi:A-kinase anchor protein 14 isoform X1 [Myotis myotis]|uniref:A-kinase anchor protein 14 isoform X1 n=1 Tax=Myotis myotis TaxID=51298 RepID=UPI001748ABE5|nr:A-kinase anchor protein 14 isoform X1 [Myotis myotis]